MSANEDGRKETGSGTYVFDNAEEYGQRRYQLLAELFDDNTIRHLRSTGIRAGWRCLEAGAGAGSIASWLAKRVGPDGQVVATDLDTTLLQRLRVSNLVVQRHDLTRDSLPEQAFDLVHLRLVLMHLPERERVLSHLVNSVKPGGWIVLEEFDSLFIYRERKLKTSEAFLQYMASRGIDMGYGRSLASALLERRILNLKAEGRLGLWQGGSSGTLFMKSTVEELRPQLLGTGRVNEAECEVELELMDDPQLLFSAPVMWTALGRRPG